MLNEFTSKVAFPIYPEQLFWTNEPSRNEPHTGKHAVSWRASQTL